ncbi:hypothetical protein AWJ20_4438 [Sugiyamaella lignohabitans]|uniref:Transmembrane protein 135 N-terminal domain-containing protein n=1 Tax=Sugiyamaella lignohabitans TaxID=796027 RepID=A0A161HHI1_9ASCO|nr:uncharacterized protein AWJ20_4438 [Sugiyamaella lignohabitans]ANB11617.1 hypothetical protein AWJ20_4438 [Sugiyamaella lignohabitans]
MAPTSSILARKPNLVFATLHQLLKNELVNKSAKGFLAAYIYVLVPRFIAIISRGIRKKESALAILEKMLRALRNGLLPNRLPAFIGKLIAAVYVLNSVISRTNRGKKNPPAVFFISAFTSCAVLFWRYKKELGKSEQLLHRAELSDTADLTTIAFVRACDLLFHTLAIKSGVSTDLFHGIADVSFFTASSFVIMFSWFFYPHRLSPSYQKWITRAANMDDDFVTALRYIRNGDVYYNCDPKTHPKHDILNATAEKYGFDPLCADFSSPGPIPCKLIHQNSFENCELHALWRFYRGFITSMSIYFPLNVLLSLRSKSFVKSLPRILIGSSRSSVFLAAYITLNWYSVCLVRTRLGPILFPRATPHQLEDTYGPGLGALTCGLSKYYKGFVHRICFTWELDTN